MAEWWQHGYPGAHMVPLPGFPRPLYPPDVPADSGYRPSIDGPDVIAYKRTVSRAGRWPWQPFDDSYSNAFAHGKAGGMVRDSGVAGVQRQQKISPASGWLGYETFKTLRSIIIPEPLPHAGEYAMDALSQQLLVEAWHMFQGEPAPAQTVREAALELARANLGYTESPAGSNLTTFNTWYYGSSTAAPWCAIFATYCYETATKGGSPSFQKGSRWAYCPHILSDAQAGRNGLSVTSSPVPGDLCLYDWEGDSLPDHVGLFASGSPSSFQTIEGNTSSDNSGSQSNGGGVYQRWRSTSSAAKVTFVRVAEP